MSSFAILFSALERMTVWKWNINRAIEVGHRRPQILWGRNESAYLDKSNNALCPLSAQPEQENRQLEKLCYRVGLILI